MRRCPIPAALFEGARLCLTEELERYLCGALRLKAGGRFIGFNGLGQERTYELEDPETGQEGRWAVAVDAPRSGRSGAPLTLCYGVPKGEKLDLVARQVTELGVSHIALWAASRSVALWKRDKVAHKRGRLEKVISEAARQCGRADVPALSPPASLEALIQTTDQLPHRLYLDPQAPHALSTLALHEGGVALLIGPEGGVSPEEQTQLTEAGWRGVSLSCPVLRTETAAVVGAALILEKMGWL